MLLPILLQFAAGSGVPPAPFRPPPRTTATRAVTLPSVSSHDECLALAERDPVGGRVAAERWRIAGGGFAARQCAALAESAQGHFAEAATRFTEAAREAEGAHSPQVADLWAQAGNAFLAAGDAAQARTALDSALAAGTLKGQALGEAQLDHARALVAAGDPDAARSDLDRALANAPADPLAWLLSATLARRQNDLARAKADITQALARSSDDASVQLEAGNIAALSGDEAGARTAWGNAARIAPDKPAGRSAVVALAQFNAPSPVTGPAPSTKAGPAR